ncbi:MAG: hypothetical protein QM493_09715 [Sulfurovum sp.]
MNLPHGEALHFAKKVLQKSSQQLEVLCIFPCNPTLAMCLEGASQSCVGFDNSKEVKIAFLSTAKNIKRLKPLTQRRYIFHITLTLTLGNYYAYSFYASKETTQEKVIEGEFTLMIKENR